MTDYENKPTRSIANVIDNPKPAVAERAPLKLVDVDLVDYVFFKIKSTWGDEKYWQQFTDIETLEVTKIDWAKDILSALGTRRDGRETDTEYAFRKKSRVDKIFCEIRQISENGANKGFEWPALKKICAYMANFRDFPMHRYWVKPDRCLEDHAAIERKERAGRNELNKMKGLFDAN